MPVEGVSLARLGRVPTRSPRCSGQAGSPIVGLGMKLEMGWRVELEWLVLGLARAFGRAVEPDPHRSPAPAGTSSDRPLHAERIRRSWEAGECVAFGPAPTRSGSPIVVGLVAGRGKRKKQVPRRARNDNSRALAQAGVETGWRAGRWGKRKKQVLRCARNDNSRAFGRAGVEVEVMGTVRV